MKKEAFIYGIQPHSNELENANRGVEKGRTSEYELAFMQQRERGFFLKLQEENKFSFIEDGKYNWNDIFRPIIESSKGIESGELKRWFETNSFYRTPVIKEKPKLKVDEFAHYIPFVGEWENLMFAINQLDGVIKGSNKNYTKEEMSMLVDQARRGMIPTLKITRSYGLREKVEELIALNKSREELQSISK